MSDRRSQSGHHVMAEHTPGPWSAEGTRLVLPAAPGIRDKSAEFEVWPADARLIAAAPDLLEALRAILPVAGVSYDGDPWYWDDGGKGEQETGLNAEGRFALAHAAIAKAAGEIL